MTMDRIRAFNADRPDFDDPRVLALAEARQQISHEGVCNPTWNELTTREQEGARLDAWNYLHAATRAGLIPAADAQAEMTTQYGFRLRDSTLLDFDTKAQRDCRMADFMAAEWQVTPLTRQVRPAQYGEWTEETVSEQHPHSPQTGAPRRAGQGGVVTFPVTLPPPSPALTLHMAAARLRSAAEAARAQQAEDGRTDDDWARDLNGYLGGPVGVFCGLLSPELALDLADHLDETAMEDVRHANAGGTQGGVTAGWPTRVARRILGEAV